MMARNALLALLLAGFCAGCATGGAVAVQPDGTAQASGDTALFDPSAPSWLVSETRLDAATYVISLRATHFRRGGDGEAMEVIRRRAQQLQRETGASAYRIVEYSEGIESAIPFPYRVAKGTVILRDTR